MSDGIGTGAPGLGKPLPDPGQSCTLTVTRTLAFKDETHSEVHTNVWDGYTATPALNARLARLRDAHRDVTRKGDTLTVTTDRGDVIETETLSWVDEVHSDA